MSKAKNIAIIDKHQIYRVGLKMIINHLDMNIIAEGEKSSELLQNSIYQQANIIFIDYGIQCTSCQDNIKTFAQSNPDIKIIALVQYFDNVRLNDLKQSGISGFILKNTKRIEIEKAIDKVINGQFYTPETIN